MREVDHINNIVAYTFVETVSTRDAYKLQYSDMKWWMFLR